MFYTIYKITNKLDGKFYIGKHQTKDLNDGYMGSGKILKRAIAKHGIDNFKKEILFIFDNEQEMNDKEKELVTLHEMSYNLCPGGKGGFGYLNNSNMSNIGWKTNFTSNYQKRGGKIGGKIGGKKSKELGVGIFDPMNKYDWTGKNHSEETKQKISSKNKGRVPWNKGIPRTEKEKQNIRNGVLKNNKLSREARTGVLISLIN